MRQKEKIITLLFIVPINKCRDILPEVTADTVMDGLLVMALHPLFFRLLTTSASA